MFNKILKLNDKYKINAHPFLKWAGGKSQLINKITDLIPKGILNSNFTYIEPFVGGGAILFWILRNYPDRKIVINDINADLMNVYRVIQTKPKALIKILNELEQKYYSAERFEEKKRKNYYKNRDLFNERTSDNISQAALLIFLNKTCFNGLYRVNRNNQFNVPIGNYKRPKICNAENILSVSEALKNVKILNGDFENTFSYANNNTFFYLDPPYKPLSNTSNFNTYSKDNFDDNEQIRLRDFCVRLSQAGYTWILSNSDVKLENNNSSFFDEIYSEFKIIRVTAKRIISANPSKRGQLKELIITNYNNEQTLSAASM